MVEIILYAVITACTVLYYRIASLKNEIKEMRFINDQNSKKIEEITKAQNKLRSDLGKNKYT